MFEGPIEDRLGIREFYGAYSDASMRQDRNLYLSLWSDDATRTTDDGQLKGKPAIAEHWDGIWSILRKIGFFIEIGNIQVSGEIAASRVYCREIFTLQTGEVMKVVGRYDDILEKVDGRWLFKQRKYQLVLDERATPNTP